MTIYLIINDLFIYLLFFPIKTCYAYHGIGINFKIQLESTHLHILTQIIDMFQFDIM